MSGPSIPTFEDTLQRSADTYARMIQFVPVKDRTMFNAYLEEYRRVFWNAGGRYQRGGLSEEQEAQIPRESVVYGLGPKA